MKEIFDLINSMAPYLLLGFLLAGIMHAFIPRTLYHKYLGGKSFKSILNATLLGIPLPLCSCGVIPTAMSLRKEGASKGATMSFLIATPQTGVDSIIATYSLLGLPFALLRPLAALVTALFGGVLVNRFDDSESDRTNAMMPMAGDDNGLPKSFFKKILSALRYSFVEMMQDIGKWLILGLVVAGLITVFVPESFFATFSDKPLLSMLLVLAFAIPMYLCATGSIPIAVVLMMKGLSPGTALVLLMAGPAVNFASMLVIGKVMGKKSLFLYLLSIICGAMLFGLGIDYLLPREIFTVPLQQIHSCHTEGFSYFNLICFVALILLLINAFLMKFFSKKSKSDSSCDCHTNKTEEWVVVVKGMHCNHCKSSAERGIMSVSGVETVDIDLASGRTIIIGNPDKDKVAKVLSELGFELQ